MKKSALILIAGLVALVAFTAVAQAQISASIQIKDLDGNVLNGQIIEKGEVIKVRGTYIDPDGTAASYKISVYVDTGSGYNLVTSWTGVIASGQTVESPEYALLQEGTYQFRFTVTSGAMIVSCFETAQARTTIRLVTPEPATIAGLAMGLGALGLFAFKKRRTK
jgi:hypothetical protein